MAYQQLRLVKCWGFTIQVLEQYRKYERYIKATIKFSQLYQ